MLALRAEVAVAVDARARRDEAGAAEAERRAVGIATVAERRGLGCSQAWGDRASALLAQVAAERSQIDGSAARLPRSWERAVAAWEAIDRPYVAAYARYRLAEAVLASGGDRAAIAGPLVQAAGVLGSSTRVRCSPGSSGWRGWPGSTSVRRPPRSRRGTSAGTSRGARSTSRPGSGGAAARRRRVVERPDRRSARISVKIASVHVSNILAKLDVDNRVEAAAVVYRLGVADARPPDG